jgi:hypothetical protein
VEKSSNGGDEAVRKVRSALHHNLAGLSSSQVDTVRRDLLGSGGDLYRAQVDRRECTEMTFGRSLSNVLSMIQALT